MVKNLSNNRAKNYKELVEKAMKNLHNIGANMKIKVHFFT